ncbi:MAG: S26 family signal peptidase [Bacteroidales bacterium]|jgi:signal peptidase I|nr:S26 family signal peptidase [Bacteroidales bacterium]MDD3160549.1 S26 family signal peptidase [Bacteroidales bacterium]
MNFSKKQWIKFGIATLLYLTFVAWMGNYWILVGELLIIDIYLTKFIPYGFWRKSKNVAFKKVMEWVDAIAFALVAVYFINTFFFQNYQIPSSSLEKSLLVGDYLFVSKLSYGPRVPNTPLSFPLAQHTLPVFNCKSYIEFPQLDYKRLLGTGSIKRNDIVVFNFPAGDTVAVKYETSADYYTLSAVYGKNVVNSNKEEFGDIVYRPVDRRENYVKRCVGLPNETLQIKDNIIYINGEKQKTPKHAQFCYYVQTNGKLLSKEDFRSMSISIEDQKLISNSPKPLYRIPLTQEAHETLKRLDFVTTVSFEPALSVDRYNTLVSDFSVPQQEAAQLASSFDLTYPIGVQTGWSRDNYGPLWIPSKGTTMQLTMENLPLYERVIRVYEENQLDVKEGKIFINGKETSSYTFKMDYYWMMGDNRHNSADSRYWGFVPEDHIVGKPIMVWLSLDKDRGWFDGKIRFSRLFDWVDNLAAAD